MLETKRLILRQWEDEDYPHFARMCASPEVMKYFPATLCESESFQLADRLRALIDIHGWGFWAVELKSTGEFIGFVGLNTLDGESGIPGAPMMEIGWRTDEKFWHKGYATEAADQALRYAFFVLGVEEIYSFTALNNIPSQMVMKRLGMINTRLDFNHPKLPDGHELQRHCLYRIDKQTVVSGTQLGTLS